MQPIRTTTKNNKAAKSWMQSSDGEWVYYREQLNDLCSDDDYLWLVCQSSNLHKVAGYHIANSELEQEIFQLAAVKDVVVFGIADEFSGNSIHVCIELASNKINQQILSEAIKAKLIGQFGQVAAPQSINFVDQLPAVKNKVICRKILKSQKITMSYVA